MQNHNNDTIKSFRVFEFRDSYVLYIFYSNEYYMSISYIALIVDMIQKENEYNRFLFIPGALNLSFWNIYCFPESFTNLLNSCIT